MLQHVEIKRSPKLRRESHCRCAGKRKSRGVQGHLNGGGAGEGSYIEKWAGPTEGPRQRAAAATGKKKKKLQPLFGARSALSCRTFPRYAYAPTYLPPTHLTYLTPRRCVSDRSCPACPYARLYENSNHFRTFGSISAADTPSSATR